MNAEARWRWLTVALIAVWILAVSRLMIADVWDETNAIVAFGSDEWTTAQAVQFVLTESMGIWRPLPSAAAVLAIRAAGDAGIAWRVMRALNIVLLLASMAMLVAAMHRWRGRSARRDALFVLTFLYSAGAVITAGWFANLFDATALTLIAAGVLLLGRDRPLAAGILFGAAFFCKETAALALPMLVLLWSVDFISRRQMVTAGIPAALLGIVYFLLRGRIIPLGSAADSHQFALAEFLPTLAGLVESWWRQTLWGSGPGLIGFLLFAVSVVAMPNWRARAAYGVFVLATAVIYWEMFGIYQNGVLMHYLMFVGRLYLIPVAITLFVLAAAGRQWALAILAVPLLLGAIFTYGRYERFQNVYRDIYRRAPLRIHYPMKPLDDPRRKIEIGDHPGAPWVLDPATGRLLLRPAE